MKTADITQTPPLCRGIWHGSPRAVASFFYLVEPKCNLFLCHTCACTLERLLQRDLARFDRELRKETKEAAAVKGDARHACD